jgi:glucan phosphoethanolaminetransferase (alkaline phosphatase superfamily)
MDWSFPGDMIGRSLNAFLLHTVVPIVLWFFALGVLLFAPMRLRWKVLIAAIFIVVGALLWDLIQIPGVSL